MLPAHSAFHTPLMEPMAQFISGQAPTFRFPPTVPLVDGTGHIWRAGEASAESEEDAAAAMREYTVGEQIRAPYHFGRSLEVALDLT